MEIKEEWVEENPPDFLETVGPITGRTIRMKKYYREEQQEFLKKEILEWLKTHTKGSYFIFISKRKIKFNLKSDATMFKLAWY